MITAWGGVEARSGVGGIGRRCVLGRTGKPCAALAYVPADEVADDLRSLALSDERTEGSPQLIFDPDGPVLGVGVLHEVKRNPCICRCDRREVAVYIHRRYLRVYPRRGQVPWQIRLSVRETGGLFGMRKIDQRGDGESEASKSAPYKDTLLHIELIARKRKKLLDAQIDAERQVLHRIGRDYVAGNLTVVDLVELYRRYRDVVAYDDRPGYSSLWDEAIPEHHSRMSNLVRSADLTIPNAGTGWAGEWPLGSNPRPPDGQSVVYVLFDEANVPCYVGSTAHFKTRLQKHRPKKKFNRWMAYPCDDREGAYLLEEKLLAEHKPYLNQKVWR